LQAELGRRNYAKVNARYNDIAFCNCNNHLDYLNIENDALRLQDNQRYLKEYFCDSEVEERNER